ncbi:PKD domain-containing protein [Crocinitomicaceae bacterium]|nr:PKD domain-containing protein [Crocinitomicaceae bacterium]
MTVTYSATSVQIFVGGVTQGLLKTTGNWTLPGNGTFNYSNAGTYTVMLEVWSTPLCVDQVQETITLNELLFVDFASDLEQCLTNNSFDFEGIVSGPPQTVYTWDFGPNATIQSSNDINVYDVSFSAAGTIPVTLTGVFGNCTESETYDIYLFSPPTIDFSIQPGLQCVPFLAQFVDGSWAETQIFYNWDFGDNTTSTVQNPSHVYSIVGSYPVTLTIFTDEGCIDTLTLLQSDLVNVNEAPTAGFSVTPERTDICASEVQMIDASEGGENYFYWFDDSTFFSNGVEANPIHQYLYPGSHYPMQVVTNEWGCKDTAYSLLFIEPFAMFIPNAFTPDGDNFNNTFKAFSDFYIDEWHLKIYNRWGQLLYETFDINEHWDGTFNGDYVPDGSYGYTLQYRTCEPLNPDREFSGHINVIR